MKLFFTLAAAASLAAASLPAHAQFTVDGKADAAEIGTGVGKYQLAGSYNGTHLEADRGLKALYVGYTATTLNIMLVGSGESTTAGAFRAFILYLNTPARTGIPVGVALGGLDTSSPLAHKPKLDMQVDYGFRTVIGPGAGDIYSSIVSYATGTGTPAAGTDTYMGSAGNKSGAVVTGGSATNLPGTKFSYFSTTSLAANTSAVNSGMEIEIPLSAIGGTALTAGSRLDLFAAFTDSNGNFVSNETIPEVVGRTTAFGADPDFTAIAGTQSVAFVLGSGALASRNAVASGLEFSVYPNPASPAAKVAYTVPTGRQAVSVDVYNALGQRVRSLAKAEQAGTQEIALGSLPAGAYLVRLQVGDQLTSRKVMVQ